MTADDTLAAIARACRVQIIRMLTHAGSGHPDRSLPERCANLCFGGTYRNRLFMLGSTSLYSLYVNTQGAPRG